MMDVPFLARAPPAPPPPVTGRWRCRPLTNDDQSWVLLPGTSFDSFADFKAWAEDFAYAKIGTPTLF